MKLNNCYNVLNVYGNWSYGLAASLRLQLHCALGKGLVALNCAFRLTCEEKWLPITNYY